MWSYPIVTNGLIYVVDVRNGLYVVRYHGRWGEQLNERHVPRRQLEPPLSAHGAAQVVRRGDSAW